MFPTADSAHAATFLQGGRPPNALGVVALVRSDKAWTWLEPLFASAATVRIPVVLVTPSVRADGRTRRGALIRGCTAVLGQPCLPCELSLVVRRVIAGERRIVSPPLRD